MDSFFPLIPLILLLGVFGTHLFIRLWRKRHNGELRIASLNDKYWVEFRVNGKWIKAYLALTTKTPRWEYIEYYNNEAPKYFATFDEAKIFADKIMSHWGLEEDTPAYVDIVKN